MKVLIKMAPIKFRTSMDGRRRKEEALAP